MRGNPNKKSFFPIVVALFVTLVLLLSTGISTAEDTLDQNSLNDEESGVMISEEQTGSPKSRSQNNTQDLDISLKWVTDNPEDLFDIQWRGITTNAVSQKYSLKISASNIDFAPGEIVVEIPIAFLFKRSGEPLLPSTISLPKHGLTASNMPFSYGTRNDKGVEYLEIKNYDPVHAGSNFEVEIGYTIFPSNHADLSVGKLVAKGTAARAGGEPIQLVSNEITYTLNTHIRALELFKNGRIMREWDVPLLGEMPKGIDFDDYRWGLYTISAHGLANLDHFLEFVERPKNNGQIVKIVNYFANSPADMIQDIVPHEDGSTIIRTKTYTDVKNNMVDVKFYIVVAYPAEELQNGDTFVNDVDVFFVNADIPTERPSLTASSTLTWSDYSFSYTGDVVEMKKIAGVINNFAKAGSLSFLRTHNDTELDKWQIDTVIQGYEHENYAIEVYDDFMDWKVPDGDFVQMGSDDYEHYKATITGEFYKINKDNGAKTYYEKNADSPMVELWAKIGSNDFKLIESIKASNLDWREASSHSGIKWAVTLPSGTTQIKVRTAGLNDYAAIKIQLLTRLLGSSPQSQKWFKTNKDLDSITIRNHCAVKMYDKDGVWINKAVREDYKDADSNYVETMIQRDIDAYGDYIQRNKANYKILNLYTDSRCLKNIGTIKNDPINRQVTIAYAFGGVEFYDNLTVAQIKTLLASDEFKNFGRNSAVFYDLLPEGCFLNKNKAAVVMDINGRANTTVSKVETIDNYRGSGRQMVIVRITMKDNILNRNESNSSVGYGAVLPSKVMLNNVLATGFTVNIEAIVPWENALFSNTKANLAAYQVEDEFLKGGYTDIGSVAIVKDFTDRNGVSLFYNLRGGENGANEIVGNPKNTLYASATPTINVATSMSEGLTKIVKVDKPGAVFSKEVKVDTSNGYTYRFTINNSLDGKVSDVILFDSLETADHHGKRSGWHGSFDSMDAWYAKLLGIDPVIYYSADENAPFFTTKDVEGNSVPDAWTTVIPNDKNDIRAIAIDLSKRSDGTLFEFAKHQSVYIEVNMVAPKEYRGHNVAYNKASYYSKFVPVAGGIASDSIVTTTAVLIELNGGSPIPDPPSFDTPEETPPLKPQHHTASALARTGDNSKIVLWLVVTFVAILCIILLHDRQRRVGR